jgi:hypothetical protein
MKKLNHIIKKLKLCVAEDSILTNENNLQPITDDELGTNENRSGIYSITCGWTAEELLNATIILENFKNGDIGRSLIALVLANRTLPGNADCFKKKRVHEQMNAVRGTVAEECFRKYEFSIWNGLTSTKDVCEYLLEQMRRLGGAGLAGVKQNSTQEEIKAALAQSSIGAQSGKAFLKKAVIQAIREAGISTSTDSGFIDEDFLGELLILGCTHYANPDHITSGNETATIILNNADTENGKGKIVKVTPDNYPALYRDGVRATILVRDGAHIFTIHICSNGGFYTGCPKSCNGNILDGSSSIQDVFSDYMS